MEIDCPEDCAYLSGAHAPAWEGRETERRRDAQLLAPHLEGLEPPQSELLLVALVGLAAIRARRRDLDDRLLREALTALRKTVETRTRGILYDHAASDLRAEDFVRELRGLFEARDDGGVSQAPDDRDLLAVLRALEAMAAERAREGAGATAFLETVTRVAAQLGPRDRQAAAPLIVEP